MSENELQTGCSVSAYEGLIRADTGADTWKKKALNHRPEWLTFAQQVQTPYHVRVHKNTC